MLRPTLITGPTVTVISLAEAKAHCRVDHSDDDTLIDALIAAAISHVDGYSGVLGRALVNQTWELTGDSFGQRIDLPVGIASSVVSVKYYDVSNVQQTLAGTVHQLATDALGSFIELKNNQSWPSVYSRADAVAIQWVAGYGAAATDVPAALRMALLMLVGHWYENREAVNIGSAPSELPMTFASLIGPFRRVGT